MRNSEVKTVQLNNAVIEIKKKKKRQKISILDPEIETISE